MRNKQVQINITVALSPCGEADKEASSCVQGMAELQYGSEQQDVQI